MKKVLLLFLSLSFLFAFNVQASEDEPVLKKTNISITAGENQVYQVEEKITVINPSRAEEGKLNHTLVQHESLDDLKFSSNGDELEVSAEKGEVLDKLKVTVPESAGDEFEYIITYSLTLAEGEFSTPLVVPMFPSGGDKNAVTISFTSPEGNYIHKNSFPILIDSVENEVTNHLMNVPSHVNYKFGPNPTSLFNPYNLISGFIFLLLVGVIGVWFVAERKKEKGVAA